MAVDIDRGVERVFTGSAAVTTGACPWASIGTRIRVGERAKRLLSASVTKKQHMHADALMECCNLSLPA